MSVYLDTTRRQGSNSEGQTKIIDYDCFIAPHPIVECLPMVEQDLSIMLLDQSPILLEIQRDLPDVLEVNPDASNHKGSSRATAVQDLHDDPLLIMKGAIDIKGPVFSLF